MLTSPGCPNVAVVKQTLAECLDELGLDVPVVERVGRYPSPTLLIDGVDVMRPDEAAADGDACRLDLPSRQRIMESLKAAGSEDIG